MAKVVAIMSMSLDGPCRIRSVALRAGSEERNPARRGHADLVATAQATYLKPLVTRTLLSLTCGREADDYVLMVLTMVEGQVSPDRASDLMAAFSEGSDELPLAIVESFLLRAENTDIWRIVSVWRSREDLAEYRASVETPGAFMIFRSAGVEPTLTIFDVARHAAN